MPLLPRFTAFALGFCLPGLALAGEPADDDRVVEETVEVIEVDESQSSTWMGVRLGSVVTPYRHTGPIRPGKRITSNQARACLDPLDVRYCGNVRGFDLRIEMFEAPSRSSFPRWAVFFRTGYNAGRFSFDPASTETGFGSGDPRALAYHTVPLFFGTNVYLFDKFPIRPYGGLGFGFDVLRLQYHRHEAQDRLDASARIGFELHAGLEARITNYVSLNVEVMQLWSARRKIPGLPDYSNEGLTFMGGVAFAIPTKSSKKRKHVRTVQRTRRVEPRAEPVDPSPAPTVPVHVEVVQTREIPAAPAPAVAPVEADEVESAPTDAPPATPAP
jgi:hypothetical protein